MHFFVLVQHRIRLVTPCRWLSCIRGLLQFICRLYRVAYSMIENKNLGSQLMSMHRTCVFCFIGLTHMCSKGHKRQRSLGRWSLQISLLL